MSQSLGLLDMGVEAIYDKLCEKCKKKINEYREALRKKKVKWMDKEFFEQGE